MTPGRRILSAALSCLLVVITLQTVSAPAASATPSALAAQLRAIIGHAY